MLLPCSVQPYIILDPIETCRWMRVSGGKSSSTYRIFSLTTEPSQGIGEVDGSNLVGFAPIENVVLLATLPHNRSDGSVAVSEALQMLF